MQAIADLSEQGLRLINLILELTSKVRKSIIDLWNLNASSDVRFMGQKIKNFGQSFSGMQLIDFVNKLILECSTKIKLSYSCEFCSLNEITNQ